MIHLRPNFRIRTGILCLAVTAALAVSGCVTFVDSHVAKDNEKGFVYYLPMPVIVVTPQADGTAKVEVEYLPDESKAYTLHAWSLVSSYTLDVQTENGMLKTVSLDADSAQVTKSAIDAASMVADKALTAAQTKRDKEEDDRKTREAKERELRQAVAVAKQELKALELLAVDASNGITPAQITAAKLAVIKAETILAVFLTEDVEDIATHGDGEGSFDVVTAKPETAPGPVMFQVEMGRDVKNKPTLKLRAIAKQRDFETATVGAPKKPAPTQIIPESIRVGVSTVERKDGAATKRPETFNTEITIDKATFLTESMISSINDDDNCSTEKSTLKEAGIGVEPGDKKTDLIFEFPTKTELPDGSYCIEAVVKGQGANQPTVALLKYRLNSLESDNE